MSRPGWDGWELSAEIFISAVIGEIFKLWSYGLSGYCMYVTYTLSSKTG